MMSAKPGLALHLSLERQDLSRDDIGVDLHRPITIGADFQLVVSRLHAERLRLRGELTDSTHVGAVDVDLRVAWRYFKTEPARVGLHIDVSRTARRIISRSAGRIIRIRRRRRIRR